MILKKLKYSPKCDLHKLQPTLLLYLCAALTWEDTLQVVLKMTEANLTIYHN